MVFYDKKIRNRFIKTLCMKKRTSSGWIRIWAVVLLVSFTGSAGTTVSGDDPSTVLVIVDRKSVV